MANLIATNFGEFSTVCTDFFTTSSGGSTFVTADYGTFFWPNGNGRALNGNSNDVVSAKTIPASTELFAHVRVRLSNGSTRDMQIFQFNEGATNHIGVRWLTTGLIRVTLNGATLDTGTTVFDRNAALSIQVRVVIHDSTGVVQVRCNGLTSNEINFSGDTRNGSTGVCNSFALIGGGSGTTIYYTDLILNDTTGSFANSWPGAARVVLGAFTITGGTGVQFTPLSSTNVSNIDDPVPGLHDVDATYNESSTAGHIDYFQLASSVFTGMSPATISFVRTKYWARAADGGTHTMRSNAKDGGTTANGATATLGSTYQLFEDVFYVNPSTSSAWATFAAIYGAEFGYELVS